MKQNPGSRAWKITLKGIEEFFPLMEFKGIYRININL